MGLFNRKTIITVASVVYPLGEEPEKVLDVVKAAITTARIQSTPISNAVKRAVYDGMGVKLAQAYSYALNNFYAGMPNGLPVAHGTQYADETLLNLLCKEHLEALHPGAVVTLLETRLSYDNDFESVLHELIRDEYHYDFYEEEVFTASGSIQVGATLEIEGPREVPVLYPGKWLYDLTFTNPDTSDVEINNKQYSKTLFSSAKEVQQRVIMEYQLDGSPAHTTSYTYGGDNPRLNLVLRSVVTSTLGTFPAISLKKNNQYLNSNGFADAGPDPEGDEWLNTPEWITSNNYARRLNLNILDIIGKIKENESEEDIDYIFVQPGTLINSPNVAIAKYHYNYFNRLRQTLPDSKTPFDTWVAENAYPGTSTTSAAAAQACPAQSIRISDTDHPEHSVDMEIAWRYISYEEKTGSLDKEYEVECGDEEEVVARYLRRVTISVRYDVTKLYFRRRLSPTTYAEICVCGPRHENYIYKGHSVSSEIWDAFYNEDEDYNNGFLIPLDNTVLKTLSPRERLQLGQEALHIVFNCYVARKQKWYETDLFKVFSFILTIVITVISVGTLGPWVGSLYATLLAIVAIPIVAAILTAILVVAIFVGISFVAKEAGEWAAEHWGAFWGALVQIGTTIALTAGVGLPVFSAANLTAQIIQTSSFILMGMSAYTQYRYDALVQEQKAWDDYIASPNDPLEEINNKLEELFPDMTFVQEAILPHRESLDEFLGRTLAMTEGLTGRLLLPITHLSELTLTPRLT